MDILISNLKFFLEHFGQYKKVKKWISHCFLNPSLTNNVFYYLAPQEVHQAEVIIILLLVWRRGLIGGWGEGVAPHRALLGAGNLYTTDLASAYSTLNRLI